MEEKANIKKKKLLTVALVFTVVLAVIATTWCTDSTYKLPKKSLQVLPLNLLRNLNQ